MSDFDIGTNSLTKTYGDAEDLKFNQEFTPQKDLF